MSEEHQVLAARSYLQDKKTALENLLWSTTGSELNTDAFDRDLTEFLSQLIDDFSFSVSSPHIEPLTRDSGAVRHLNQLVADCYGANAARVWTAGSSVAVLAVLGVLVPKLAPNRPIIVCDPFAHKSAFGAFILSGLDAAFLPTELHPRFAVPRPTSPDDVKILLKQHHGAVAAVFITSPTYEGMDADLEAIGGLCREHDALLVVDAAWGSQYGLFPNFPASAVQHADIVITSPHKAGLTPCQIGLVQFRSAEHAQRFDEVGDLGFATTSPNQLLLQITEHRFQNIREAVSDTSWRNANRLANELRSRATEVHERLWAVSPDDLDAQSANPTHLLLFTGDIPVDGRLWADSLSSHAQIDVELATDRLMLLLLGGGTLTAADRLIGDLRETMQLVQEGGDTVSSTLSLGPAEEHLRPGRVDLRTPYFATSQTAPISDAVGKRAAGIVTVYPPGRPILTPGQMIDEHHVDILTEARVSGAMVTGTSPEDTPALPVIAADAAPEPLLPPEFVGNRRLEIFRSSDITAQQLNDYVDLFREVFCNWPFNQFAFQVNRPLEAVSPSNFLLNRPVTPDDYFDLDTIESIALPTDHRSWMDPQLTHDLIKERCACDGYLVFATDETTGQMEGFIHARVISLRTVFETEEWRNPMLFSGYRHADLMTDEETFFGKTNYHFGLQPHDQMFYFSGMGLRPSCRGRDGVYFRLMNLLTRAVSPEHAACPLLGEIAEEGPARAIEIGTAERTVYGFLGNGHDVVFTRYAASVLHHFEEKQRFSDAMKRYAASERAPYRSHPQDNPKVEIRTRAGVGRGIYATAPIEAGETIAVFAGERYRTTSATALPEVMVDHAIQVSETEFVHGERGLAELCNHSCEPNSGIRNLTEIFAARRIEAGEEICWDYRCSEDSDWRLDPCSCGAPSCTGVVEGFSSLPDETKQDYLSRGLVSEWIVKKRTTTAGSNNQTDLGGGP